MSRRRPVALVALVALASVSLAGCRLGVEADVTVERDGSGTIELAATLDEALLDELDELDVDPTAELTAAAAAAPEWTLARSTGEDGSLTVALRRDAADPDELTDALRELTAGLDRRDPALALDLDLEVDDAGAAVLTGEAQLRAPVGPGVLLDDAATAALAELTAETVDARLVVSLPGPVVDSDADQVNGTTLTWELVPGDPRPVSATSSPPPLLSPELVVAIVAGVLVVIAVTLLVWMYLRRRRAS